MTDTPRTDAAEPQLHSTVGGWVMADFARELERELAEAEADLTEIWSRDKQMQAEAEVKEIRSALGDDGRRTHKEILEMAFKASEWKCWKEKYIDLKNAYAAEGQDPNGTIWEHADNLQKELAASKAEVERLKANLRRNVEIAEEIAKAVLKSSLIMQDLRAELDQLKASLNPDKK